MNSNEQVSGSNGGVERIVEVKSSLDLFVKGLDVGQRGGEEKRNFSVDVETVTGSLLGRQTDVDWMVQASWEALRIISPVAY